MSLMTTPPSMYLIYRTTPSSVSPRISLSLLMVAPGMVRIIAQSFFSFFFYSFSFFVSHLYSIDNVRYVFFSERLSNETFRIVLNTSWSFSPNSLLSLPAVLLPGISSFFSRIFSHFYYFSHLLDIFKWESSATCGHLMMITRISLVEQTIILHLAPSRLLLMGNVEGYARSFTSFYSLFCIFLLF